MGEARDGIKALRNAARSSCWTRRWEKAEAPSVVRAWQNVELKSGAC